jgi:recombination protein RecA
MQDTQLDHAISAIRVRFGSQALTRAAELPPPQPWASCTPLDRLTGIGGLPRGRLTLLTGSGTCGKLTLALAMLAGATHEFAHAVVIDNRSSFDPWALLPFDPDLSSLTMVRLEQGGSTRGRALPGRCERGAFPPLADTAGEAAATLAKAGAGFILLMGEVPEPWLGPLETGANRSGTVLVGVIDTPGRAFAHASSLSLGFSRTGWVMERGQLVGLRTIARCLKNRVAPPLGESELEIRYPLGAQLFPEHPVREAPLQVAELECTSAVV